MRTPLLYSCLLAGLALASSVIGTSRQGAKPKLEEIPLPTGMFISPTGKHVAVGSFPCNMVLSPDGKYLAVTNAGPRQNLTILRTKDGIVTSQIGFDGTLPDKKTPDGLYFGLAFKSAYGRTLLFVSRGATDKVSAYQLGDDGILSDAVVQIDDSPEKKGDSPMHPAGLAVSSDGGLLYVANNQTVSSRNLKGSLAIFDEYSKRVSMVELPGFPLDVKTVTKGADKDRKVYVTSERDGVVVCVDPLQAKVKATITTGANPTHLLLDKAQKRLFVANSGSDTVSVIDTANNVVQRTILVRPDAARGLPGATPLGMALSPDEKVLYVTLADLNAVALVNLPSGSLKGYIPTGWYPTAVQAATDGQRLFVSCAKGVDPRKANKEPGDPTGKSRYILDILDGAVSFVNIPSDTELPRISQKVVANNRLMGLRHDPEESKRFNPGIKHVIYIVKENRTYDQVLGDLKQGNGDADLCMFPREVTPNQHALAERFVLLDNFYVCAEVSADGWSWSVGGIANEYNQRNHTYGYSGRPRSYDYEGSNNGVPVELKGLTDVARPAGGYLWDLCKTKGVNYRNYGMYVDSWKDDDGKEVENAPNKKALVDKTCLDYSQYNLSFTDSDAWVQYGISCPKQTKEFGPNKVKCRFEPWKREYDEYVKNDNMPGLMLIRLPNDHTMGSADGFFTARAMVADNDYALGRIVETVSKGPYWKSTAIVVVEDDAQAGYDHVDAHRSTCYVISPFVKKATKESKFYNTDSVLRSMELLLDLPPMTVLDAVAPAFGFFLKTPDNDEPYTAILPPKEIICAINTKKAYRSSDSTALISLYQEESLPDIELNDILWGSIMGAKTPRPPILRNVVLLDKDDD